MAVALRCEASRGRRYVARLRVDARRLMSACDVASCELSVVISDDDFIRALNREFRGKDRATDVLSFSQLEEVGAAESNPGAARARPAGRLPGGAKAGTIAPRPETPLGDVIISAETAERQARRLGVAPEARMRTLLVHGMLHVLGYDHERSTAEARRMFARERELSAALAAADAGRTGARGGRAIRKAGSQAAR